MTFDHPTKATVSRGIWRNHKEWSSTSQPKLLHEVYRYDTQLHKKNGTDPNQLNDGYNQSLEFTCPEHISSAMDYKTTIKTHNLCLSPICGGLRGESFFPRIFCVGVMNIEYTRTIFQSDISLIQPRKRSLSHVRTFQLA